MSQFNSLMNAARTALTSLTNTRRNAGQPRRLPAATPAADCPSKPNNGCLVAVDRDGAVTLDAATIADYRQANRSWQALGSAMTAAEVAAALGFRLLGACRTPLRIAYRDHNDVVRVWKGSVEAAAPLTGQGARPGTWGAGLLASLGAALAEAAADGPGLDCQMVPEGDIEVIFEAADYATLVVPTEYAENNNHDYEEVDNGALGARAANMGGSFDIGCHELGGLVDYEALDAFMVTQELFAEGKADGDKLPPQDGGSDDGGDVRDRLAWAREILRKLPATKYQQLCRQANRGAGLPEGAPVLAVDVQVGEGWIYGAGGGAFVVTVADGREVLIGFCC